MVAHMEPEQLHSLLSTQATQISPELTKHQIQQARQQLEHDLAAIELPLFLVKAYANNKTTDHPPPESMPWPSKPPPFPEFELQSTSLRIYIPASFLNFTIPI